MKRLFITLITFIAITTGLMAQAHLRANVDNVDLGQVEWNNPVRIDYTIHNDGDIPLLIVDVLSSCGCSVPEWSSEPIEPGKNGKISVDFDAKALGKFHKEISIYSNSTPNLVYLSFTGEVVRKITDFKNSHPIKVGSVRLDRDTLNFGAIEDGDKKTLNIKFVNESNSIYRPVLMHQPSFVDILVSDSIINKGSGGEFDITIDTNKYRTYGLVNTEVYLSRFVGDKICEENKIPISFIILPKLENTLNYGPAIKIDTSNCNLSEKLQFKNKAKGYILIENGEVDILQILKVQTFSPAVEVKLKSASIVKGDIGKLQVTIDKNKMLTSNDNLTILVITNDPNRRAIRLSL